MTGAEQEAKDAVQDAHAAAYQCVESLRGDSPRAWILAIVRNACYSLRKRKASGSEEAFDEVSHSLDQAGLPIAQSDNNPETLLLERRDRECVRKAIQRLPVKLREVLVLREMADLSYTQIAQVADIPLGTVIQPMHGSSWARSPESVAGAPRTSQIDPDLPFATVRSRAVN